MNNSLLLIRFTGRVGKLLYALTHGNPSNALIRLRDLKMHLDEFYAEIVDALELWEQDEHQ